ncbi:MAG: AAA family ATPase [Candidatus Acidiferrales bacterium]
MIKSLELTNFRCFKELYIREFKRFNIVVGESGSGKTALLESVFLTAAASPEVWMRLRQWRGSGNTLRLTGTRASYESMFRDIFYNFEKRKPAKVEFSDYEGKVRSLKVSYPSEDKRSSRQPMSQVATGLDENSFTVEPIVFAWKASGKEQKTRVDIKDGKLNFRGFSNVYPVWFSSPLVNEAQIVAQAFSEVSLRKKSDSLIRAVKALYPEILDIGVESIAGDLALCASLSSLPEKIPVGTMSSGITRFLTLMVAIASNPNGVLLIDEFEVGFYYATLQKLLNTIVSFCEENNVQIIATTHSYEFMQTLLPLMKPRDGTDNEFRFFRAERQESSCSMKVLEDFPSAIESAFEVR